MLNPSGLVFPMYDLDGNTFRLRIRKDFSDIDATVITSGQDRFYYAEGKKYFISMKGVYFVTPGGEKEFLPQKENTEPWLPTIRILRLQHVEYWPTSIKGLRGCKPMQFLRPSFCQNILPLVHHGG